MKLYHSVFKKVGDQKQYPKKGNKIRLFGTISKKVAKGIDFLSFVGLKYYFFKRNIRTFTGIH